jgi:hypothetical protein
MKKILPVLPTITSILLIIDVFSLGLINNINVADIVFDFVVLILCVGLIYSLYIVFKKLVSNEIWKNKVLYSLLGFFNICILLFFAYIYLIDYILSQGDLIGI